MSRKGSYVDYMSKTVSRLQDQLAEHTLALDILTRQFDLFRRQLDAVTHEFLRHHIDSLPDPDDPVT